MLDPEQLAQVMKDDGPCFFDTFFVKLLFPGRKRKRDHAYSCLNANKAARAA